MRECSHVCCRVQGLQFPRISLGLWESCGGSTPHENAREKAQKSFDCGMSSEAARAAAILRELKALLTRRNLGGVAWLPRQPATGSALTGASRCGRRSRNDPVRSRSLRCQRQPEYPRHLERSQSRSQRSAAWHSARPGRARVTAVAGAALRACDRPEA